MRLRLAALAVSLASLVPIASTVGCGGAPLASGTHLAHEASAPEASLAVSDDAFAGAVRALLASAPGSADRASRLAGVEARQMERAATRFKNREPRRGLASVLGGLALVHKGELASGLLGPAGPEALRGAARELSTRGDEGRAEATFEIWMRIAAPADKPEIQGHLDALASWMKDAVARGGPVQSAGALESVAVSRRLVEPSDAAMATADMATTAWIDKAFALRASSDRSRHASPPSREEIAEAVRGLQTGAIVLAAIHLRDTDAAGAIAAIEKAQAQDLAPDGLIEALKKVAGHPTAEGWVAVLHTLRPSREQGEEPADEEELVRAAAFAVAMEAYRLDPTLIDATVPVAAALDEYGMAEASPLVFADAVRAHPDPRLVSGALKNTMNAMAQAMDAGEGDAARRTFRAAHALLDAASDKALVGQVQPSPARVRAFMGDIEVREGHLKEGEALLEESVKTEKLGSVLLELARIRRHDKRAPDALAYLQEALAAKDAMNDVALRGEILLETSDIAREQGDLGAARTPLTEALTELSKARNAPDPDDRARVERTLSRVLDRFGAADRAAHALDRAYDAAPRDKHQAAATVGQIVARAFVSGDLAAARDGLQRGLAADLEDEDLVYYALWVRLLERQRHVPTDGVADRIFARAADDAAWIGRLAQFGAGSLPSNDLIARAKTPSEKTEAIFYVAVDRRAAGDAKGADSGLRQVLDAAGIDLMEAAIARDILDGPRAKVTGPLPPEATQPP